MASKRPNPSIGIIGAGAAGLSLARILTDRGFANITLIERSPRVGGKSLTYAYKGVPHELGTCYTTYGYTYANAWMEEYGIEFQRLKHHWIHVAGGTPEEQTFRDYVLGKNKVAAYAEMARYVSHWFFYFFWRQQLEVNKEAYNTDMALTFGDWLDKYNYKVVKRFAQRTITAMGYGDLYEVPALNGLRWNVPSLLLSAAVTRVDEPIPGWEALWQNMAWSLDVRLGCTVKRIERTGERHQVSTDQGEFEFDHLIITSPPDELSGFMDLREDEREQFQHFSWGEYVTTLVEARDWFKDDKQNTWSFLENLQGAAGERRGHLLVARRTGDKTEVSRSRSEARPDVYVCYQYGGPDLDDDALTEKLRQDISARGGTLDKVVVRHRWKYMPRLDSEAIRGGAVWKLAELQGKQNTWYSGAAFSHEAVDNIVDFNWQLAWRMEAAFGRYEAQPLQKFWWLARKKYESFFTLGNK